MEKQEAHLSKVSQQQRSMKYPEWLTSAQKMITVCISVHYKEQVYDRLNANSFLNMC
jgi:hypothetical protein